MQTKPGKVTNYLETFVVIVSGFLFYLLTFSNNLGISHDSSSYINDIDRHVNLCHPHHLLYHESAYLWLQLWRGMGYTGSSVIVVQLLNVLFASFTLAVCYRIFRNRFSWSVAEAVCGLLPILFSYGIWLYSTVIEVYTIPLFLLLLTCYLLSDSELTKKKITVVSITFALAVLYHQVNILFGFVILGTLIFRNRQAGSNNIKNLVARFFVVSVPIVILPYLSAIIFVKKFTTIPTAWNWLTMYAHSSQYWNMPSLFTLGKILYGFCQSFVGGQFLYRLPLGSFIFRVLNQHLYLADDLFLVREVSSFTALLLSILCIGIVLFVAIGPVLLLKHRHSIPRSVKPLLSVVLLWFGIYSLFFCFWDSSNVEFWLPQSICVWLLVLTGFSAYLQMRDRQSWLVSAVLTVSLSLFFVNYFGSMKWVGNREYDYFYVKAAPVAAAVTDNDMVVTCFDWEMEANIHRSTNAEVVSLSLLWRNFPDTKAGVNELQTKIRTALKNGQRIVVTQDAIDIDPKLYTLYGEQIRVYPLLLRELCRNAITYSSQIDTFYMISNPPESVK